MSADAFALVNIATTLLLAALEQWFSSETLPEGLSVRDEICDRDFI